MRPLFVCVAVLAAAGFASADNKRIDIPLENFVLTAEAGGTGVYYDELEDVLNFRVEGTAATVVEVEADGTYTFEIEMAGDRGEFDLPQVLVSIGGVSEVGFLKKGKATVYKFKLDLKKGQNAVVIEFLNDSYEQFEYDCNLYVHSVKYRAK